MSNTIPESLAAIIYDLLVDLGGAPESEELMRRSFLHSAQRGITEYRFQGHFGLSGKFWVKSRLPHRLSPWFVSSDGCDERREQLNKQLDGLWGIVSTKHDLQPDNLQEVLNLQLNVWRREQLKILQEAVQDCTNTLHRYVAGKGGVCSAQKVRQMTFNIRLAMAEYFRAIDRPAICLTKDQCEAIQERYATERGTEHGL